jgi:hypothetical protein
MRRFATLLAAGATAAAIASAAAQPGPSSAPSSRPVGARVDTSDAIIASLRTGYHAILFLGRGATDQRICQVFVDTYSDGFLVPHTKVIYFARRSTYADATLDCRKLTQAYDVRVQTELDDDLRLGQFTQPRLLMIICRDRSDQFIDKGHVVFDSDDGDSIQRKFTAFESYYRKGPDAWSDRKEIDKPFEVLNLLTYVVPQKNTACK